MKRLSLLAVVSLLLAWPAGAQSTGRAMLTFEHYDFDGLRTTGLRQSYDLGLQRALTTTSLVRLLFHADDLQATSELGEVSLDSGTRVLQPTAELLYNNGGVRAQVRADVFRTTFTRESLQNRQTLERSFASFSWQPQAWTQFAVTGQQNVNRGDDPHSDVRDQYASATLSHSWRGFQVSASERYNRNRESSFDRKLVNHLAALDYSVNTFDGRFSAVAAAQASRSNTDEQPLDAEASSVPVPVPVTRALFGVDDTPSDGRDHPLAPYPLLTDGALDTSAGISLGPTAVSFQNIALDLGRSERLDEIRVVVRDPSGNPLRNGGGPVTWDVYTSTDGQTWIPIVDAQTTFETALSRYQVVFTQTFGRWFKVVNFGVNSDETFVTEIQALYHASVEPGTARKGEDTYYTISTTVTAKPVSRLTLQYTGNLNSLLRDYSDSTASRSDYSDHLGSVEYALSRAVSVRGEHGRREATSDVFQSRNETATGTTGYLLYHPTRQLQASLEYGVQDQSLGESTYSTATRAVRVSALVLPTLSVTLAGGRQVQRLWNDDSSTRSYFDLSADAKLTRTLRMMLQASMQKVDTDSTDPLVQFLGAVSDNRVSSEFIWRPGRPLTLSARIGYVSGAELSGMTHRIRADWRPFEDGTLSLGGSYDQDIDPITDRRATRAVFSPRWSINSWAAFDLNYTSVSTEYATSKRRQQSFYATLILTR